MATIVPNKNDRQLIKTALHNKKKMLVYDRFNPKKIGYKADGSQFKYPSSCLSHQFPTYVFLSVFFAKRGGPTGFAYNRKRKDSELQSTSMWTFTDCLYFHEKRKCRVFMILYQASRFYRS